MSLLLGTTIGLPIGAVTGFVGGAATYQIKTGKFQDLVSGDVGAGLAPGIVGVFLGAASGTICGVFATGKSKNGLLGGLVGGVVGGLSAGVFIGTLIK